MLAHIRRHLGDRIVLSRLQRLISRMHDGHVARLFGRRFGWRVIRRLLRPVPGRSVAVTGAEGVVRAVRHGSSVAVVVEIHVAKVPVRFGELPTGLVLRTRRAAQPVSVAVRTEHDRRGVVEVKSVVAAHP